MLVKIKSVSIRALRFEEKDRLLICKIASSTRSSNVVPPIFYSPPLSFSLSLFLLYSTHFYHSLPPLLPLPPLRRFFVHSLHRRSLPLERRAHKLVRYLGIILNIVDRTMAFQSRETRLTFTCNYLSRHAVPRNAITPQANRIPLSSGWKKPSLRRIPIEP